MSGILTALSKYKVGSLVSLKLANSLRLKLKKKQENKEHKSRCLKQAQRKRAERAKYIDELKLIEASEVVKQALNLATLPEIHNDLMDGKYTSFELINEVIRRTVDL